MTQLTAGAVRRITGPMDEARILEIIKTGASEAELVEALEWLHADDAIAKQVKHQPSARVSELRDILGRNDIATDDDL
ncbi:MAG: hypothetical protein V2I51_20795 [Anderseniella sp.]|nr:hypothetical protein [Anderseniella sp.]